MGVEAGLRVEGVGEIGKGAGAGAGAGDDDVDVDGNTEDLSIISLISERTLIWVAPSSTFPVSPLTGSTSLVPGPCLPSATARSASSMLPPRMITLKPGRKFTKVAMKMFHLVVGMSNNGHFEVKSTRKG